MFSVGVSFRVGLGSLSGTLFALLLRRGERLARKSIRFAACLRRRLEFGAKKRQPTESNQRTGAGQRNQYNAKRDRRATHDTNCRAIHAVSFRVFADRCARSVSGCADALPYRCASARGD